MNSALLFRKYDRRHRGLRRLAFATLLVTATAAAPAQQLVPSATSSSFPPLSPPTLSAPAAATVVLTSSTIRNVIVFPGGAIVERVANARISAGVQRLTVTGLPPWLEPSWVEAALHDSDGADILAAQAEVVALPHNQDAAIATAEAALRAAEAQLARVNAEQQAWVTQAQYIDSLAPRLHQPQTETNQPRPPTAGELKQINDYLATARLEIVARLAELQNRSDELDRDLQRLHNAVSTAKRQPLPREGRVHVDLHSVRADSVTVAVRYLVPGASWHPRHTVDYNRSSGELSITSDAIIQQATGENWENVAVSVATSAAAVQIAAATLNAATALWQQAAAETAVIRQAKAAVLANLTAAEPMQQQLLLRAAPALLPAQQRLTVKTDAAAAVARLENWQTQASLRLEATPALSRRVVASGHGTLPSTVQALLPAPLYSRHANSIVGRSQINLVLAGEAFKLPLGSGDFVVITRGLTASSRLHINGDQRTLDLAYVITLQNTTAQPLQLLLREPLPLLQEQHGKVTLTHAEPRSQRLANGDLAWQLELPPAASMQVNFRIAIEYAAETTSPLLRSLEKLL